jgi:hypothetical protein
MVADSGSLFASSKTAPQVILPFPEQASNHDVAKEDVEQPASKRWRHYRPSATRNCGLNSADMKFG